MSLFSVGKMIVMKKFLSGIICVISISLVGCTLFIPSSIQLESENVALQSNGKTTSAKIYDNKYTSQSNSGSSLNFFGSDMLSVWESKENGVVYTIIKPLENKPDSSATIISIFAIIFSILIPVGQAIYNHYVDSKNKVIAVNEGFWMREVFIPKINSSLNNIVSQAQSSLTLSDDEYLRAFRDNIFPSLDELRDSIDLLSTISESIDLGKHIENLFDICEKFENDMQENQLESINIRKDDMVNFYFNFTKEMLRTHTFLTSNQ